MNLVFVEPCYWVLDVLGPSSVMVDMGLGFDADFSVAMIKRYELTSYGFDPTQKHAPALQKIADHSDGHFHYHQVGIGAEAGSVTFHESVENVSGSIMSGHTNVKSDAINSYDVTLITLDDAFDHTPDGRADFLKMDIEGPEYDILRKIASETIRRADQWCVEFHHDTIDGLTFPMTMECVRRFEAAGYRTYTRDNVNFLFYNPSPRSTDAG